MSRNSQFAATWVVGLSAFVSAGFASGGVTTGDFNGDGFADLAVGTPFETVGGVAAAGAINVMYGGPGGLSAQGDQYWTQDSPGVANEPDPGDQFGGALCAGDFNDDGFDDLAIGSPREDVGEAQSAGIVHVLYGSAVGLTAEESQVWHQSTPQIEDDPEEFDIFGSTLAAGDFNDDGFDDLVIAATQDDVGAMNDSAGQVHVIPGSAGGLVAAGSQVWSQRSAGIGDRPEDTDNFGRALAAGDFNNDGFADLAIGVPFEDADMVSNTGVVHILYGAADGLTAEGSQVWHQDLRNVQGSRAAEDQFGAALAAGDFDGDGLDDLAIGAPGDAVGASNAAGAVHVFYGSGSGLRARGSQRWHQNSSQVRGIAAESDRFGRALAAADFNSDGSDDLAIGVPGENVEEQVTAGAVNVIFGSSSGLTSDGNEYWSQQSHGIASDPLAFEAMGVTMATGDFNRDTRADLVVGVPGDTVGVVAAAGAAHALYGSATGLRGAGSQYWHQDVPGILGVCSEEDRFSGLFD